MARKNPETRPVQSDDVDDTESTPTAVEKEDLRTVAIRLTKSEYRKLALAALDADTKPAALVREMVGSFLNG